MPKNVSLTPHFSLHEFLPDDLRKSDKPLPDGIDQNIRDLAQRMQVLRDLAGRPILIHSGYRGPAHNQAVGGASHSYHLQGKACDFSRQALPAGLVDLLWQHWSGGMGLYPTHIHLDLGPRRRWHG